MRRALHNRGSHGTAAAGAWVQPQGARTGQTLKCARPERTARSPANRCSRAGLLCHRAAPHSRLTLAPSPGGRERGERAPPGTRKGAPRFASPRSQRPHRTWRLTAQPAPPASFPLGRPPLTGSPRGSPRPEATPKGSRSTGRAPPPPLLPTVSGGPSPQPQARLPRRALPGRDLPARATEAGGGRGGQVHPARGCFAGSPWQRGQGRGGLAGLSAATPGGGGSRRRKAGREEGGPPGSRARAGPEGPLSPPPAPSRSGGGGRSRAPPPTAATAPPSGPAPPAPPLRQRAWPRLTPRAGRGAGQGCSAPPRCGGELGRWQRGAAPLRNATSRVGCGSSRSVAS